MKTHRSTLFLLFEQPEHVCEIQFWKQSNKLVARAWEKLNGTAPASPAPNFWWHNLHCDRTTTPRPHAPGGRPQIFTFTTQPKPRETTKSRSGETPSPTSLWASPMQESSPPMDMNSARWWNIALTSASSICPI